MGRQKYLRKHIKIAGKSTNGFTVLSGCFKLTSTIGLPLEDLFFILYQKNILIDWIDFIEDPNFDWKIDTLFAKIEIFDVDVLYKQTIINRLKEHINKGE